MPEGAPVAARELLDPLPCSVVAEKPAAEQAEGGLTAINRHMRRQIASAVQSSNSMPAPTVALLDSSIRMKLPVV